MADSIILRKACAEDFEAYFLHKCEKSDIYWNGFSGTPDKEGLKKAFLSRIEELDSVETGKCIEVVELGGIYAGYIQYTFIGDTCEIGIGISEKYHGRGIGRTSIQESVKKRRLEKVDEVFARIRDDNEQSQKCFLGAGFKRTEKIEEIFYESYNISTVLRKYIWEKEL